MSPKISKALSKHRLEQAAEELEVSKILYEKKYYKSANNRAYYCIFHSIKAVLALEPIDFKRHKDVIGYFNKNYVKNEIFPRKMETKIVQAQTIREDSDYDDEYVPNYEKTTEQIETAGQLIELVEEYVDKA